MTIDCPACGKRELPSGACPRCGSDLTVLHTVAAGALWHVSAAAAELRARNWQGALRHASAAWRLDHRSRGARLAFLAAGAAGQTALAACWHARALASKEPDAR